MLTEHHTGPDAFSALAGEWDALAGQSMTDTPFQTLAYQQAWWQHLPPPEATLHTITARAADGRLAAIGCFFIQDGSLHFNGCVEETDYLDLIVRPEEAAAAWTAVLNHLRQPDFPAWRVAKLCNIPGASPTRQILPQLAAQQGLDCREVVAEVCPVIPLPTTFDAYLEMLDSKQRREVQRKLRRAAAADAQLVIVGPADDLTQAVDEFLALLQLSTFAKRDWLHDGRRAAFHAFAQSALAAGTLQLMFIAVEGQKAAALFNFDYKGRIWVYNSGLDPDAFGGLSLGVVLTAKAIEHAIENGRTTFDFLRGNETYKYRFGAQDTEIYQIKLQKL
ncbi:MAG: GNAT family N-acetyltransferase [Chloroflexi bacterium]|nr:GNAT family N-acetyltransferase [Chloroflexota bacterium]